MRVVRAWLHSAAVLVAAGAGAAPAGAQVPQETRWSLEGGTSYCIWYLADPLLARQMVPSNTVLAPAGAGEGLPFLLVSTIQNEPQFAQWIPGLVCIGYYDKVVANGRVVAEAKPKRPVMVAMSSLAAHGARGISSTSQYLMSFLSDTKGVIRAADGLGLHMDGLVATSRNRIEGDDPEISIDLDGAQIIWSGHAIAQPSVGKTLSVSFGYAGPRGSNWQITMDAAPTTSRAMVGALQVTGSNDLAKVLRASPVRAIGPEQSGGTITLTLLNATHR